MAKRTRSAKRRSSGATRTKRRRSTARSALAALPPALKVILGAIGPLTALVGTLLALNIISPFQNEDALASSVTKLEASTSALNITFTSPDREVEYSANGVYDFASGHGVLTFELPGTSSGVAPSTVEVRFLRHVTFVAWSSDTGRWIKIDPRTAPEVLERVRNDDATAKRFRALLGLTVNDPSEVLGALHGADVEELGDDTELGIPTTRYRAELPAADTTGSAPIVFIEIGRTDGLVRKLAVKSEGSTSAGTLVLQFPKFGVDVDVKEPPARSVIELEELLERL